MAIAVSAPRKSKAKSLIAPLAFCAVSATAAIAMDRGQFGMINANVHNHAWILLHHHRLTQCNSGLGFCKCVSCYNLNRSVSSVCYALLAPIPR